MDGPDIIVRTLSQPAVPDKHGNLWQYHSRSDRHSKVACWAVLFDLLQHSPLLATHAAAQKVTFGINRTMRDFRTGRTKDLDLVISRPGPGALPRPPATMPTWLCAGGSGSHPTSGTCCPSWRRWSRARRATSWSPWRRRRA